MRTALFAVAMLSLTACGSPKTETIRFADGKGGTTTITSDGTKATFTGEVGASATLDSGAQKARFTDFAPQYPGSTVESAASIAKNGSTSQMINLLAKDDGKAVYEFYKASLPKSGAKITEMGADGSYSLSSGDAVPGAMVTIAPDGEGRGTTIALIINTKD